MHTHLDIMKKLLETVNPDENAETSTHDLIQLFWHNFSDEKSKRLTAVGMYWMSKAFEVSIIELPKDYTPCGADFLFLEEHLNAMFHIDFKRKEMSLFDTEDAFMIGMYGSPKIMREASGFSLIDPDRVTLSNRGS